MRSVKRMTKFLEQKRPVLTKICLVLILQQSNKNYPSPMFTLQMSFPILTHNPQPVSHQPPQVHDMPQPVKDQITKKQFLEYIENFKNNLFKPLPSTAPGFPFLHIYWVFTLDLCNLKISKT